MNVVCQNAGCPYNSKHCFCTNKLIIINKNGTCGHVYRKDGSVRENWQMPIDEKFKEKFNEE